MVRKLRIQYPGVVHDLTDRGDQREAVFGDRQPRVCSLVAGTGERNRQVQSEAQGRLINPTTHPSPAKQTASGHSPPDSPQDGGPAAAWS
jgi:hypothetical protein